MGQVRIIIAFISILFLISLNSCVIEIPLPGDISGYVTDAETNDPLPDASIELTASIITSDTTSSGEDGSYLLKNISQGAYEVKVSKLTYRTESKAVGVNEAQTSKLDFSLSKKPSPIVFPDTLDFGLDSTMQYFTISNTGSGSFTYSVGSSAPPWITISPAGGEVATEMDTIWVTIDRTGLSTKQGETITVLTYIDGERSDETIDILVNGVMDQEEKYYYGIVRIGTQVWMAENLNKGEIISFLNNQVPKNNAIIEKYCYNDDQSNLEIFGGLYTWQEMMDYAPLDSSVIGVTQGICPDGWHIPTLNEWEVLIDFLGGPDIAGGKMKDTGTISQGNGYWNYPNIGATNESGFSGLPGKGIGAVTNPVTGEDYLYFRLQNVGRFWSSETSEEQNDGMIHGIFQQLSSDMEKIINNNAGFTNSAFSVRCIRDQ